MPLHLLFIYVLSLMGNERCRYLQTFVMTRQLKRYFKS
uniref:Uncharacterized protein n=1 Tax=Anguilla anguilla TaxID=7936 RepID=A0A0E9SM42_ANGAN